MYLSYFEKSTNTTIEVSCLFSVYLLATRKLELGPPEGFNNRFLMLVIGPDGHQGLTNVDTGNKTLGFAKSTSHSSLEPKIVKKKKFKLISTLQKLPNKFLFWSNLS